MALDAGAIIAHLKLDTKEFKISVREVKKGTDDMSDSAKKGGGAFSGLWKQVAVGMGVTNLIGKGIGFIKNQLADTIEVGRLFERNWANATTQMNLSAEAMDGMRRQLLNLSPTLGSATELADGMYEVISAGVPAGEAIEFLGNAAKSAKAGFTDSRTAIDALTTVINAYGLSAGDATRVSDMMFESVKRGKQTYAEMATSLGTVVPIASQVGLGFDQVAAAMATLTRQGIDANTATVQLRQIMVSVLNPSREAEKTAKALGLEFNATALATKGLNGFLADVMTKTKGDSEALTQLFGNVRALTGVMALGGAQAKNFANDLDAMKTSTGQTDLAFQKQMNTLDFWMTTAKNSIEKLKISFFQGFAEPIKGGIKNAEDLELQLRLLQKQFEEFGKSVGKVFKFVMDNAGIFWAALRGPQAWAKEMSERASGIKGLKKEMMEAQIESEKWASTLTNLNIPAEELAQNYQKNTEQGAIWRQRMEELNEQLEAQKFHTESLSAVVFSSAQYMREQVSAILETSKTSEEAQERIRNLREFMKSGGEQAQTSAGQIGELDEATKKYKEKIDDLLDSLGINSEKNRELIDTDKILHGLFESGKITLEKFNKAHKELVEQMFEYGEQVPTAIEQTRILTTNIDALVNMTDSQAKQFKVTKEATLDWNEVLDKTNGTVGDTYYGVEDLEDRFRYFAGELGVSTAELLNFEYALKRVAVFLQTGVLLPEMDFSVWYSDPSKGADATADDIGQRFSQLYDDIKRDFGDTFATLASEIANNLDFVHGEFFDHAIDFKQIFEDLWGSVKDSFFRMIGDITGDAVLGLFKNLFKSITGGLQETLTKGASDIAGAVGGISQGAASAMTGVWTGLGAAIGSFLGTLLGSIFGGGPSGHAQQQAINDTKDSRNFLAEIRNMFTHVNPSLDYMKTSIPEKFDGLKGSVDLTRSTLDKTVHHIGDQIEGAINKISGAQRGAFLTSPELIMTHGTPNRPEVIAPLPDLNRIMGSLGATAPKTGAIDVKNQVNLVGTIISDREYVRERIIPEIINALDSSLLKARFQRSLGVA